jgi:dTDP-4-amino-4,6-dideoxy-D-galactose acyltransferase
MRPLLKGKLSDLRPLLRNYGFAPYSHYGEIEREKFVSYLVDQIEGELNDSNTVSWVAHAGHGPVGLVSLTFLEWDTRQLGVRAARIGRLVLHPDYAASSLARSELLGKVYEDCTEKSIRFLTARLGSNETSFIHQLEDDGFNVMDGIITFSYDLRLGQVPAGGGQITLRQAEEADSRELERIAFSSFTRDRFHADPRIPPDVADRIYENWIRNSLRGIGADVVIVGEAEGRLAGFVTCRVDERSGRILGLSVGTIALVAVDGRARGKGVGTAMMLEALRWFREHGAAVVEVGTQLRNIPSSRVYERMGFRLVASSLSLRKWME